MRDRPRVRVRADRPARRTDIGGVLTALAGYCGRQRGRMVNAGPYGFPEMRASPGSRPPPGDRLGGLPQIVSWCCRTRQFVVYRQARPSSFTASVISGSLNAANPSSNPRMSRRWRPFFPGIPAPENRCPLSSIASIGQRQVRLATGGPVRVAGEPAGRSSAGSDILKRFSASSPGPARAPRSGKRYASGRIYSACTPHLIVGRLRQSGENRNSRERSRFVL